MTATWSPPPSRNDVSAASSAGSAEPSSPECALDSKRRPSQGTPAESAAWWWSSGSMSGDIQRLGEGERTRVQGLAHDRALHAQRHEVPQRDDVVEARDSARGDDRLGRARGDLAQELEVRALQGSVLRDVGDDVAAAAGLLESPEHGPEVAALLGPAPGGERRAAHVESDRDHIAVASDP